MASNSNLCGRGFVSVGWGKMTNASFTLSVLNSFTPTTLPSMSVITVAPTSSLAHPSRTLTSSSSTAPQPQANTCGNKCHQTSTPDLSASASQRNSSGRKSTSTEKLASGSMPLEGGPSSGEVFPPLKTPPPLSPWDRPPADTCRRPPASDRSTCASEISTSGGKSSSSEKLFQTMKSTSTRKHTFIGPHCTPLLKQFSNNFPPTTDTQCFHDETIDHISDYIQAFELRASQYLPPYRLFSRSDFNCRILQWDDSVTSSRDRSLEDFLISHDLFMLNSGSSTHFDGRTRTYSCIDVSMCSPALPLDFTWTTLDDYFATDHFPILLIPTSFQPALRLPHRRYDRADWSSFTALVTSSTPLHSLASQLEEISMEKRFSKTPMKDHAYIPFEHASAVFRRTIHSAKRASWSSYLSSITQDTPIPQVWSRIRKIAGKHTPPMARFYTPMPGH
ncbi:hypothetical protein Pcinc_032700 [Petrolisthes cinctipes]|uniref:Endonuclease/exonuclease/phosphatase domain-containing protein n=1 Tax=Petrolisthes cinctipes TaxID=88211 RepID=A0AAE1ETR6_PETCI|nr:hypothetical protein Pcinc_032700 [Petrolisthes cinctipes]